MRVFQRLKRLSIALLVVSMATSGWSSAYAAGVPKDSQGHWAHTQLSAWLGKGYIQGYEDGSLRPDDSIKRGELFALINRIYGWKESAAIAFTDLANEHWAYAEAAKAVKAGYIEGYEDNSIRVESNVSRQELAVIVTRLLRMDSEEGASGAAKFADASSIPGWSRSPIGILAENAIINGYEDGAFRPTGLVTRAEAVVMLDRASSSSIYHRAGIYGPATGTDTMKGNIKVTASGVTLQNMKIEGDLILTAGIGKGDVTLKNVTVTGTTRILGGGVNSIHLDNSVLALVSVNNKISTVRIVLKGTASIQDVSLHTAAIIVADEAKENAVGKVTLTDQLPADAQITLVGNFEAVTILAKRILLEIPEGTIAKLTVDRQTERTKLVIGKEAAILSLVLNAAVSVFGQGNVQVAIVNSPGVEFEKQPQRIEIGSDATTQTPIKIGDKEYTLGDLVKPVFPVPGPSAGGSSEDDEIVPPPGTISPRITIPLEGAVTESVYVNKQRIATVGDTVYGISDQRGFLYLVPGGTDRYISMLDYFVAEKHGQRIFVEANQKASFNTAGLPAGDYMIVARNEYYLLNEYSADQEIRLIATPDTPLAQNSVQVYSNSQFVDIGFNKPIRNALASIDDLSKSVTYSTYTPTGTVTSYTYAAGDTIEMLDNVLRITFGAAQPNPITLTVPGGVLTDDKGVPLARDVTVSFEFGPSLTAVNPGTVLSGSSIAVITDKATEVYLVKRGVSVTKSDMERAVTTSTATKVRTDAGQQALLPTKGLVPGEYVMIAWGGSSASIVIR